MKKLICALTLTVMLCGCGNSESTSVSEKNMVSDAVVVEGCSGDEDRRITYDSLDEFRGSTFYRTMKESGYTPYMLQYDEERYTFERIVSDAKFYEYYLLDNIAEKVVCYEIQYDSYKVNVEQFGENAPTERNIKTTAERDGQVYDVYLSTSAYTDEVNYYLNYLPFEHYEVSFSVGNNSTADEILAYFNEFTLVPDEEDL